MALAMLANDACGQADWPQTRLTTMDGLLDNSARHIMQDHNGFLWMATLDGISRYDGYEFVNIVPEEHTKVRQLHMTGDDFLLAWTYSDHYLCYDCRAERFREIPGTEPDDKYSNITFLSDGDFWLWGPHYGCAHVKIGADRELTGEHLGERNKTLPSDCVLFVERGVDGRTYISTWKGLFTVEDSTPSAVDESRQYHGIYGWGGHVILVTVKGDVLLLEGERDLTLLGKLSEVAGDATMQGCLVTGDELVMVSSKGCHRMSLKSGRVVKDPCVDATRSCRLKKDVTGCAYIEDERSNVWMSVPERVGERTYRAPVRLVKSYEPDGSPRLYSQFTHIGGGRVLMAKLRGGLVMADTIQKLADVVLPDIGLVKAIGSDKTGSLWVSTELTGVIHVSAPHNPSERVWPKAGAPNCPVRLVKVLKDSTVAIGTRDGLLNIYDLKRRMTRALASDASGFYCVLEDEDGCVWAGTRSDGLMRIAPDGGVTYFRHDDKDPTSLSSNSVYAIHEDHKGRIWVGTYGGGLDVMEHDGRGDVTFRHVPVPEGLGDAWKRVHSIAEDIHRRLWVGTTGGLVNIDPEGAMTGEGEPRVFTVESGDLLSNEVKAVYIGTNGNCMVAEAGVGVAVAGTMGSGRPVFKHYGRSDGLPNGKVQAFAEDKTGDIWISTEYGLANMALWGQNIGAMSLSAVPEDNIFAEGCAASLADGRILMGNMRGVMAFDPKEMTADMNVESVTFTALRVDGMEVKASDAEGAVLRVSMPFAEEICPGYDQNFIEVCYSTLDLKEGLTSRYSTKLTPLESDWSSPSRENKVTLRNMEPGEYVLHVCAINPKNEWGEEKSLRIVIAPPVWRTWWAYLLYALVVALALGTGLKVFWKIALLKNKVEVEKSMTEMKLVFFTNISHEFRTPLTLIVGVAEKLLSMSGMPSGTARHLEVLKMSARRMTSLVNQLLEFRKMEAGKLKLSLQPTEVVTFVDGICRVFRDVADQKSITFIHDVKVDNMTVYLDQEKVDKMLFNLLSNSFKYTPDGGEVILTTSLDRDRGRLVLSICDTGIGVPPEKRQDLFQRFSTATVSEDSVGIGLSLASELVALHKGEISYSPNPEVGSTFRIMLPLNEDVYDADDFAKEEDMVKDEEMPEAPGEDVKIDMPSANETTGKKVLVVEDQADIRELIVTELRNSFVVMEAVDGADGLEKARRNVPDLVITDVMMPRMDGMEATRRLKADPLTAHIPVMMLTALTTEADNERGVESGADVYVRKPFSPRLLQAHCRNIISSREALAKRLSESRVSVASEEEDVQVSPEMEFVATLNGVIVSHMDDTEMNIETLSREMGMGRTAFFSKVKSLTGYSPVEYVKVLRMKRASDLLKSERDMSIAEVAFAVGYSDPYYFSRSFKQHFGVSPTAYREG